MVTQQKGGITYGAQRKKAYLEAIRQRYRKSNRDGEKRILDEFCTVCKYNRKYAIRLLNKQKSKTVLSGEGNQYMIIPDL